MKENQVSHLALASDFHSFEPARMSPTFSQGGELFRRILRVVNQHIRTLREQPQIAIALSISRLVIRSVNDRAHRRIQSVAQAALRMIQPCRGDLRSLDFPFLAASNL